MAYESEREKEIARIISEELNDPQIPWAAIDAAAKRISNMDKPENISGVTDNGIGDYSIEWPK